MRAERAAEQVRAEGSREVQRLYDWLSRFNLLQNLRRFGRLRSDLTMHKTLRLPPEAASRYGEAEACLFINDEALVAADLNGELRVLDAGCGFGGTVFRWQESLGGIYDGLTLSPVQLRVARREAKRRGLEESCRFHLRSYDAPLEPDTYDVVVAIEALVHSLDFPHTLANLARALKPGGKLVLVEDTLRDGVEGDSDLALMSEHWGLGKVPTDSAYREAFEKLRLRVLIEKDYTELVQTAPPDKLDELEAKYRRILRVPISGVRFVAGAFLGGIGLERLYRKQLVRYRLTVAQPE